MKTYQPTQFRKLPDVCRIWIKPNAGRFKTVYCFGIKHGDQVRIEETNQIIYPKKLDVALVANIIDVSNFNQTIKSIIMSTTKTKTAKKKAAKKVAKKSTKKVVSKNATGRKPNAESMASKIGVLYAKGKSNADISEALGVTNKYVCDVTWRINNPNGLKKKAK